MPPMSFTHQREGVLLTLIKSRDPTIEITFSGASASADVEMGASFYVIVNQDVTATGGHVTTGSSPCIFS